MNDIWCSEEKSGKTLHIPAHFAIPPTIPVKALLSIPGRPNPF
jgi:hypothetical protein